jgi:hypothetical protein
MTAMEETHSPKGHRKEQMQAGDICTSPVHMVTKTELDGDALVSQVVFMSHFFVRRVVSSTQCSSFPLASFSSFSPLENLPSFLPHHFCESFLLSGSEVMACIDL